MSEGSLPAGGKIIFFVYVGGGHSHLHTLENYPPVGKIHFERDIKFFHYFLYQPEA